MDTTELRERIRALNLTQEQLSKYASDDDDEMACLEACARKYPNNDTARHLCELDCYNHVALERIARDQGII